MFINMSSCQLSAAELSRLSAVGPGTTWRVTWHQLDHWLHFVSCSRHSFPFVTAIL